jgi:hypothetical protein
MRQQMPNANPGILSLIRYTSFGGPVEPLKVGNVIHIEPHVPNAKQNMELSFEVAINEPNPHHSRRWNAEEFFVRLQQRCDKGKTWLDGETDSKVEALFGGGRPRVFADCRLRSRTYLH